MNHNDKLLISNILDPSAWAIKYLIEASVGWNFFVLFISGINLNRLSSRAAHTNIQFLDDIAITDLVIITDDVIIMNGDVIYVIKI